MLHDPGILNKLDNRELIEEFAFWVKEHNKRDSAYMVFDRDIDMIKDLIVSRMGEGVEVVMEERVLLPDGPRGVA